MKSGAGLNYKYDDNIRVSAVDPLALGGVTLDGFVDGRYATQRMEAMAYLKLGVERYDHVSVSEDNPLLIEPTASDFDNESYDLNGSVSYSWELHSVSMFARSARDSTLNTQFQDTGLGGLREIEGSSPRDTVSVRPSWRWQLTERQQMDTSIDWQTVDYENSRYVDYDYVAAVVGWSYLLSEQMQLQIQPRVSRFENEANISVKSKTLGLQGGFIWSINEKWKLDLLAGGTRVHTEYGSGGYFVFNPETGQIEFIEIEDQDNNGFTGDLSLNFSEEYYGFVAKMSSGVSPSGNGVLRYNNRAQLTFYWNPRERMRVDIDAIVGQNDSTDDRVSNKRDFSEAALRIGYQFAENWWASARYRYRTNETERSISGAGSSNLLSATLSYKLPKEIL
ncbi:MAG: hypothetical protein V7746_13330 [Halioglobus sp.]